jgi:pyrroline-5-carboxylate reductase
MLYHVTRFAEAGGLSRGAAVSYTSAFFASLCKRAERFEQGDLHTLALEMTPGGRNEFALNSLTESGAIKEWADVLQKIMKRIQKA